MEKITYVDFLTFLVQEMENKLVSEHGQTEKRLDFENLRKKRKNGDDSTKAIIILSNFE